MKGLLKRVIPLVIVLALGACSRPPSTVEPADLNDLIQHRKKLEKLEKRRRYGNPFVGAAPVRYTEVEEIQEAKKQDKKIVFGLFAIGGILTFIVAPQMHGDI